MNTVHHLFVAMNSFHRNVRERQCQVFAIVQARAKAQTRNYLVFSVESQSETLRIHAVSWQREARGVKSGHASPSRVQVVGADPVLNWICSRGMPLVSGITNRAHSNCPTMQNANNAKAAPLETAANTGNVQDTAAQSNQ